jgi:metal-responsive CopG/Arc/MetJ family transcriptional regulator
MQTIELTIDESLLARVQQAADSLQMTRSDFIRVALERAVQQRERIALERHNFRKATSTNRSKSDEINEWQSAQE